MIIVTGGAGFIGSNLVKALNLRGCESILIVDNPQHRGLPANLGGCRYLGIESPDRFLERLRSDGLADPVDSVFHLGACTDTTLHDTDFMMRNNFAYSRDLLAWCRQSAVPFIYASSAAVYGNNEIQREESANETPLNPYAASKLRVDHLARQTMVERGSQIAGLRFFNVYGPGESHKLAMASVAYHFYRQIRSEGAARLFDACNGFGPGEQRRDFLHVDDAVDVMLWFHDHPEKSGIFNVGTGSSRSFNELARAVIDWHGSGSITYVPFPKHLNGHYQPHTEADISRLRAAGYARDFSSLEQGIDRYLTQLETCQ